MTDNQAQSSWALPAVVTIAEAEILHDGLVSLQTKSSPSLDASAVERIDTSAFQQLLAFKKSLENTNSKLIWVGVSDVFVSAAKQLGIHAALCGE
jgi:anti-anti-sigma regulatory factor